MPRGRLRIPHFKVKKIEDASLSAPLVPKPAKSVLAADRLIKLKKENKLWESIEEIVKIWAETKPHEYRSYLVDVSQVKGAMKDPKFGTTRTRDSGLRRTLDIPETVMFMIRKLYSPDELPMNRKFFQAWAKKFPKMMVVEKM
jgi:hypothetical protein